ncbi:MAG: hypothetical protein F2520_05135 [Actinobacteria bacterium]|nr:hypothetical protein [Actinomycetota bacterium]MTA77626.1 hypothetical protein [Actinomycetota bacterium]
MDADMSPGLDHAELERCGTVLRQAFTSAQIGMPSEDMETAVETLWIIMESLIVDHLAPDEALLRDRGEQRTDIGTQWRRLVTAGVTNTFVLGGMFVMPEQLLEATAERALRLRAGTLLHTRRPPGHGALVFGVHQALLQLDGTATRGEFAGPADADALVELIALAALGATLAGEVAPASLGRSVPNEPDDDARVARTSGRWTRDPGTAAAAFGIPGVELVEVIRTGWACDSCGCVFAGKVEAGVAYPDRFAPVGRGGPCDSTSDCACHSAPVQREVR